jgi:anti-sigma regulatory factor (Ser/Thr protein kinase)
MINVAIDIKKGCDRIANIARGFANCGALMIGRGEARICSGEWKITIEGLLNTGSGRMVSGADGMRQGRLPSSHQSMKRKIEFASHPANLSSVRKLVRQFALDARMPREQVELIVLGVDEACANIIRHVYGEETRLIGLSCEQLETAVRFRLRDYGNGTCEPSTWCGRALESIQPGGLGLHLIRTAFDHVDFRPKRNGMELVLTKKFKKG